MILNLLLSAFFYVQINSRIASNNLHVLKLEKSSKKRNRNNLPPFPPALTIDDLIKNAQTSDNKPKMVPNAFIAYRMALIREYRIKNKNIKLPRMGVFSRIAENSWNKEPQHVKGYYNKLTQDAKLFYKQNTIQIVLDKHMININDQKREQMGEPIQVNDVSTSHICSINASFKEEIRILQEYVKILEQTIDSLLAVDYKL
ncbi:unnamed protein product [Rhizophagus irregularis]|nr:unnamed protein product [Rhizophagus irregularis]